MIKNTIDLDTLSIGILLELFGYTQHLLALVVQRSDNTMYWINHYPVDGTVFLIHWIPIYPLDSVHQPLNNWALTDRSVSFVFFIL